MVHRGRSCLEKTVDYVHFISHKSLPLKIKNNLPLPCNICKMLIWNVGLEFRSGLLIGLFYMHLTAEESEEGLSCGSNSQTRDTHLCLIICIFVFYFVQSHMHHYMEKMTTHIKTFCLRASVSQFSSQHISVTMVSLRRSANQLKCSLCLYNTALCYQLAFKPWRFTVVVFVSSMLTLW